MARRGIPANAPDFDNKSLQGAKSDVGYLQQPAIFDVDKIAALIDATKEYIRRFFWY